MPVSESDIDIIITMLAEKQKHDEKLRQSALRRQAKELARYYANREKRMEYQRAYYHKKKAETAASASASEPPAV